MDDPASFILIVLFGVLGIFILVRIVKYASRTVDKEQAKQQWVPRAPAPAKEVRLSMTPAEVEAAVGVPDTKVDLGEKVLYKYKNMTVEFHDGKVKDVH
jgi:xanthosine utilization system XapX-like protein